MFLFMAVTASYLPAERYVSLISMTGPALHGAGKRQARKSQNVFITGLQILERNNMSTEKKGDAIPTLTLTPNQNTDTAVAVAQAVEEKKEVEIELKELKNEALEFERLSEAEQAAVKEFSAQIDVKNAEQIMNYGSAAQKNISEFSSAALGNVKTKDMDEIGKEISDLVVELRGFNFNENRFRL